MLRDENFEEIDLKPDLEFRSPDDGNPFDKTVFTVKLPQGIQPGQSITVRISFQSKIPSPISRTGVYKDNYFIAQWFPKLGVFQEGQWNCHQYHSSSEYFADYGTYDVSITIPSKFVIGATGEHRVQIGNEDGTTTHHFYQHSVHDFAWTASPHLLEYKEDYEFSSGKSTEITLLLQPEHKKIKGRYLNAVKNAIKYSSLFYGDYPYTTATCVDPGYNSRSGGMEYPTFFTGGAYFLTRNGIPRPEGVTIHEFGHGYFYGLVGSNEFENPWMDEGFTSFLDTEVYYAAYGEPVFSKSYFGIPVTFKGIKIPIESDGISRHRQTYNMDPLQRYSWEFMEGGSYGANSYSKAELMLRTLKRFMGKDLFAAMIKDYSLRWWFKHPKPNDFYDVVSEYVGEDMSWFLDQFIYGSEKLDYATADISNLRPVQPRGMFDGEYKESGENNGLDTFESAVLIRRLGEVKLPVEVKIFFEDGETVMENWDGLNRWIKFNFNRSSPIIKAVVDPDFKLVLDINRTNNSLKTKPNRLAPLKGVSAWLLWLQHFLEFFTLFGG
ncbi:MAG: M1 family metallopeptidase [Candidatus Aminicenantes bacterium]|nr:M1 family metallopeptidase [Candidatus Aminicenantes bacterium]